MNKNNNKNKGKYDEYFLKNSFTKFNKYINVNDYI